MEDVLGNLSGFREFVFSPQIELVEAVITFGSTTQQQNLNDNTSDFGPPTKGLELVKVRLSSSPSAFVSKAPLLVEWSAAEWNSNAEPHPITVSKRKPTSDKDHQLSIPVEKVFERIFKALDTKKKDATQVAPNDPASYNPVANYVFDDCCYSDFLDNPSFNSGKYRRKKKFKKKLNRRKILKPIEGNIINKKKKRLTKPLTSFYDVPLPKSRPSKNINYSPSPIFDSGVARRNLQFIRDHVSLS